MVSLIERKYIVKKRVVFRIFIIFFLFTIFIFKISKVSNTKEAFSFSFFTWAYNEGGGLGFESKEAITNRLSFEFHASEDFKHKTIDANCQGTTY